MRPEWEAAIRPNERTQATYLADNLVPAADKRRLRLLDGETSDRRGHRHPHAWP